MKSSNTQSIMASKVLLVSLCILACANCQGASSHVSVSRSDGGEYSYDISHEHPGTFTGSAHPHGYGGFGYQTTQSSQNEYQQQYQQTPRPYSNPENVRYSQGRQNYPVGTLHHREHANRGTSRPSYRYNYEGSQGYSGREERPYLENGYRGHLLGNQRYQNDRSTQRYDRYGRNKAVSHSNSNSHSINEHRRQGSW